MLTEFSLIALHRPVRVNLNGRILSNEHLLSSSRFEGSEKSSQESLFNVCLTKASCQPLKLDSPVIKTLERRSLN